MSKIFRITNFSTKNFSEHERRNIMSRIQEAQDWKVLKPRMVDSIVRTGKSDWIPCRYNEVLLLREMGIEVECKIVEDDKKNGR